MGALMEGSALPRLPDWQARLTAFVMACRTEELVPGRFDCMLFAAGAVMAVTGVDLAAPWRRRYSTFRGGQRILRRAGHADHVALLDAHLPVIHPSRAVPGDLAAVPGTDGLPAIGVIQGAAIFVLGEEGGLALAPLLSARSAWKVG
ncbi:DUF6950 family protein [Halodurantibacterium flavum]|uniref:DUF6950 family protein n=1 Tax=Halodurantibacterium flavum TaxID=1382802 RepID=A0ABW4SAF4_9RHOB